MEKTNGKPEQRYRNSCCGPL